MSVIILNGQLQRQALAKFLQMSFIKIEKGIDKDSSHFLCPLKQNNIFWGKINWHQKEEKCTVL